jgi:hypothetical protein
MAKLRSSVCRTLIYEASAVSRMDNFITSPCEFSPAGLCEKVSIHISAERLRNFARNLVPGAKIAFFIVMLITNL